MDTLRMHQLTKEMVAGELRLLGDPHPAAAAVVRRTLVAAFQGAPRGTLPTQVIEDAVKGAMTALLLADHNLARGGVAILAAVLDVAAEAQLDPTETMRAALRGLADMRRFVEAPRLDELRTEIGARYMGAGEEFAALLRASAPFEAPAPR